MKSENVYEEILNHWVSSEDRVLDYQVASLDDPIFDKYPHFGQFQNWLEKGYQGTMKFLENHLDVRNNIRHLESGAQSVVVILFAYPVALKGANDNGDNENSRVNISSYARSKDYHHEMREAFLRLREICLTRIDELNIPKNPSQNLNQNSDEKSNPVEDFLFRSFSDSAPVFERDLATLLGLGWLGKNACLINKQFGSGFFIGGFVSNIPFNEYLPQDKPEFTNIELQRPWDMAQDFCGGCTQCIDACPTSAIESPGVIKANQCISYWTIEHQGKLNSTQRKQSGDWAFGCDICQSVCPWNHKSIQKPTQLQEATSSESNWPQNLESWLGLLRKGGGFKSQMKETPLYRAGRRKLLRNMFGVASYQGRLDLLDLLKEIRLEEEGDWSLELDEIISEF